MLSWLLLVVVVVVAAVANSRNMSSRPCRAQGRGPGADTAGPGGSCGGPRPKEITTKGK